MPPRTLFAERKFIAVSELLFGDPLIISCDSEPGATTFIKLMYPPGGAGTLPEHPLHDGDQRLSC